MANYYDVDKSDRPYHMGNPEPGYNSVPEYLVASLPWMTSSTANSGSVKKHEFEKVSSYIMILNNGTIGQFLRVGFTERGVDGSTGFHIKVNGASSVFLNVRVKEFYVRADGAYSPDYSVMAGLTMISSKYAPTLTASVLNKDGYWNGVG